MKRRRTIYIGLLMIGTAVATWDVFGFWAQYLYGYVDPKLFEVRAGYTILALLGVLSVVACLRPGRVQQFLGVLFLGSAVGISVTGLVTQCFVSPRYVYPSYSIAAYGKLLLLALVGFVGAYVHGRASDDQPGKPPVQMVKESISWKAVAIVVFLLAISTYVNIWFVGTLRVFQYNYNHGWFGRAYEGEPDYPIEGITSADLKSMMELIDKEEGEPFDRRVLSVRVIGSNEVEITTGRLTGNLGGNGRHFRFVRGEKGWQFDRRHCGGWIAEHGTEPANPDYVASLRA